MKTLNPNLGSIAEWLRRKLMVLHLQLLQSVYRERPIPLGYWLILRSVVRPVFRFPDPLFPPSYKSLRSTRASLQVLELQQLLWNDLLGLWTLDGTTIGFLWKKIQQDRPKLVIECGAGVSTLILGKYAALCWPEFTDSSIVFSLEQDFQLKQVIESRLAEYGVSDRVQILHTPISEQGKYELDTNKLWEQLGSKKVDWLLIDGPSGPEGCRVWTLPLLARFCRPGARWFLDDALRDGELRVLREWLRLPGIVVEGIYPIGKGLGTGVVKDPQLFIVP